MKFNRQILLILSCAGLLFIASIIYACARNEKTPKTASNQDTVSLNQPKPAALSQPSTSPNTNAQNSLTVQAKAQRKLCDKNTEFSGNTALAPQPYPVIDEFQQYKFTVNSNEVFSSANLPNVPVNFDQQDLLNVLVNTRKYYQDYATEDEKILSSGILGNHGVQVTDILKTLDFMIVILQEDIAKSQPTRLQDPNFLNTHFRVIKWSAYNPEKPCEEKLRITKYAVFTHPGSYTKTPTFNIPIYALKDNANTDKFYTKYTKQDVLSGIYEPGGKEFGQVETLAYLTREGLEEALLEGTILINFPDGSQGLFNVDRSNEIAYVRSLKPKAQKRYWYFKKVDAIKGYGYKIDAKIPITPGVTFAGDVLNIGLGRVVIMEYNQGKNKTLRMGVLADTGGAFLPNLHQLDFLAGVFESQKDFQQSIKQLPSYATTYILVKK